MRRFMIGLAWLSILGSILALGLILVLRYKSIDGHSAIFGWRDASSRSHAILGLSYDGRPGFYLAAAELVVVAAAAWLSCMRAHGWRRLGLVVLVAWSALWLLGAVQQLLATRELELLVYTPIMALVLAASVLRACWRWTDHELATSLATD